MADVPHDVDTDSIKFLIEDNFNNLIVFFAQENDLKHSFADKISWVNSAPYCWPNFIFNTFFEGKDIDENVNNIVADIKKESPRHFGWWGPTLVFPISKPSLREKG